MTYLDAALKLQLTLPIGRRITFDDVACIDYLLVVERAIALPVDALVVYAVLVSTADEAG